MNRLHTHPSDSWTDAKRIRQSIKNRNIKLKEISEKEAADILDKWGCSDQTEWFLNPEPMTDEEAQRIKNRYPNLHPGVQVGLQPHTETHPPPTWPRGSR